jgi:hypothetical protein
LEWISFQSSSLAKKASDNSVYTKTIKGEKGGNFKVNQKDDGIKTKVSLKFPKNSFNGKEEFVIDLSGALGTVEFGPDGFEFNKDLTLKLEYTGIELTGITDDVKFGYFNEETGNIEIIADAKVKVNYDKKQISADAPVSHFSRYGFVK